MLTLIWSFLIALSPANFPRSLIYILFVISGFNTDIESEGTVYHVQTEDKGEQSRLILSLVYDGGTILASKRATYDELKIRDVDEKVLAEHLSRQHKLICAAVRAGRIDQLIEMTAKKAVNGTKSKVKSTTIVVEPAAKGPVAVAELAFAGDLAPVVTAEISTASVETAISATPIPAPAIAFPVEPFDDVFNEPVIDAHIVDEIFLPDEAVEVVSELSGAQRPTDTKLSLELLGDSKFRGGDKRSVSVMICRGTERKVVAGAQIMVKVLGSSFRPVIFHARSDNNGLAKVHLQMPHFSAGRAAILIRALSDGEEVELRRLVQQG